ncbi:hypothetical protein HK101_001500, partial [Irineochytrium annulatum]
MSYQLRVLDDEERGQRRSHPGAEDGDAEESGLMDDETFGGGKDDDALNGEYDDEDNSKQGKGRGGAIRRLQRPFAVDMRANEYAVTLPKVWLRSPMVLIAILAFMLVIIIMLSVRKGGHELTDAGDDDTAEPAGPGSGVVKDVVKSPQKGLSAFTMDDVYGFGDTSMSYKWVTGDRDGTHIVREPEAIVLKHVDGLNTTTLAKVAEITDEKLQPIPFTAFTASSDLKYLLLETNHEKGWRHSFFADYWLYNVAEKIATPLASPASDVGRPAKGFEAGEVGSGKVSLAIWSPEGHSVAWVKENDVYVTVDGKSEGVRITNDGSKDLVNGVADWVYEEEVLGTHDAMWFSPDGTRLAFLKFNETMVPDYHLQQYIVSERYPKDIKVKYPKAGAPNPVVTLHIATPSNVKASERDIAVEYPADLMYSDDDRLIVEVKWVSNESLLARFTNRVQDSQKLFLIEQDVDGGWMGTLLYEQVNADGAWVTHLQPITVVPPTPAVGRTGPSFLELREDAKGFTHIAYHSTIAPQSTADVPDAPPKVSWLTTGAFEVVKINAVDAATGAVYYTSTEEGSTDRHLYVVHLDGSGKRRLTPEAAGKCKVDWGTSVRGWNISDWRKAEGEKGEGLVVPIKGGPDGVGGDYGVQGYFGATFSPGCGWYVLSYQGPDVPYQCLINVATPENSLMLEKNERLHRTLRSYAMPRQRYLTIPVGAGDDSTPAADINVRLLLPFDFDSSGETKYPLLVKVYGGPNSQSVAKRYDVTLTGFEGSLAAAGYVIAFIDPRGTGFKGRAFRSVVSKRLGVVEADDVVEATKALIAGTVLPGAGAFIDARRVAVWGWSYGGFMAAKITEKNSGVFAVGMSVAPVTDWRFYDSIYTERYMKTPLLNPAGYDASAITNMTGFKNADYLLMHGMLDDNVHIQNAATLIWKLTGQHVRSYRSQFFTDSDHSIYAGGANPEVYALLYEFMTEHFAKAIAPRPKPPGGKFKKVKAKGGLEAR